MTTNGIAYQPATQNNSSISVYAFRQNKIEGMEKEALVTVILITAISLNVAKLPEEDIPVPEMIKYWGYPVEIHEAETADGYYLTLHRIPSGRNNSITPAGTNGKVKPAIFLQHGLLASSSDWVVNFPDDSLGFMLADAGFDVWLGNVRGNTYSKKHASLSVKSVKFWAFSFDEMAMYDLPAMINYVLQNTTQEKLYYVGHSQGTMMIFAGLSENQDLQEKVKVVFALAPVTRLKNIYSPIKDFARFEFEFKLILRVLGINDFLPSMKVIKFFADNLCPIDESLCADVMYLIAGYDKADLNKTRIPIYYSHTPAGTSVKNMYHFAQLVKSGVFQKYDYGVAENLIRYHSKYPPVYQFETIKTAMVIISGSKDWLATPDDVEWTASQLQNLVWISEITGYNHLDFVWGMSAQTKVYDKIIKMLL